MYSTFGIFCLAVDRVYTFDPVQSRPKPFRLHVVGLCLQCGYLCVKVERRCREGQESEQRLTAWHNLALTCPRTCGLCDDTSPTTCQLPRSWRGTWTDAASGAAVTVNETAMNIRRRAADDEDQDEVDGGLTMGCVRWRTDAGSDEEDLMLVTLYGAGCRPRYRCARVLRQSSSLLYLQLSDASSWPLIRSPRDPVDCRAFNFDRWTSSPPAVSATTGSASTTSGYLLSLVAAAGASSTVDCRLPPDVAGVQYEVEFVADGVDTCSGTLTETDGGGTLRLAVFGCGSAVLRQFADPVYKCLDSSPVAADSRHDRVIITSSGDDSTLSCWLFTHVIRRGRGRGRPSSTRSFYLLAGDQCHVAVAARSRSSFRPSRQLTYTAFFSRPRPLSTTTVPQPRSTPSQSSDVTEPVTPSTVWTSESPQRPRPHNVTTAESDDDDEQSGGFADGFIVAVASIIMAVIQLILVLCWC